MHEIVRIASRGLSDLSAWRGASPNGAPEESRMNADYADYADYADSNGTARRPNRQAGSQSVRRTREQHGKKLNCKRLGTALAKFLSSCRSLRLIGTISVVRVVRTVRDHLRILLPKGSPKREMHSIDTGQIQRSAGIAKIRTTST
jgi:hypothetical protein